MSNLAPVTLVSILASIVQNQDSFSVHDLTTIYRSHNQGVNIPHKDVKSAFYAVAVGDIINKEDYVVSRLNDGNGNDFNVFHPSDVAAAEYDSNTTIAKYSKVATRKTTAPAAPAQAGKIANPFTNKSSCGSGCGCGSRPAAKPAAAAPAAKPVASKSATAATVTRTVNTDGRFSIPSAMTASLGWKPHQQVFLHKSKSQNVLVIADQHWPIHDLVAKLTVDRDGNVRIRRSTYGKTAVGANASSVTVRAGQDHITVA